MIILDDIKFNRTIKMLENLSPAKKSVIYFNVMKDIGIIVENKLRKNLSVILKKRTGLLAASIGSVVKFIGNKLVTIVGSGVRTGKRMIYANIHETGGIIRPIRQQRLTVPLTAAMTATGRLRKPAREWENTFISKDIIFQKRSKNKVIPLFVLKKFVKIPARKYLSRTVEQIKPEIAKNFTKSLQKHINTVNI